MSNSDERQPLGYHRKADLVSDLQKDLREYPLEYYRAYERSPKVNFKLEEIPSLLDDLDNVLGRIGAKQMLQKVSDDYTNGQAQQQSKKCEKKCSKLVWM